MVGNEKHVMVIGKGGSVMRDALLYFEVPHPTHLDGLPEGGVGHCSLHMLTQGAELDGFFRVSEIQKCFELIEGKKGGRRHLVQGNRHSGPQDRLLIISLVTENWNDNIVRISVILLRDVSDSDGKEMFVRGVFSLTQCRHALSKFERRLVSAKKKRPQTARRKSIKKHR